MNLEETLLIKNKMSAHIFLKKKKMARIFSMADGSENVNLKSNSIRDEMRDNVNGVGISLSSNNEYAIKLFTKQKLTVNKKSLAAYYDVAPESILIKDSGKITFRNNRHKQRPICPGISIGHFAVTAGTLGCLVKDDNNNVYILSNNHVLANSNNCNFDDVILQPDALDGGNKTKDIVAKLSKYIPLNALTPNNMDAAIAKIIDGINYDNAMIYGSGINGTKYPDFDMHVEKIGRTTGKTQGTITTKNIDLQVDYNGQLFEFENQFEVSGNFSEGGDSGSLIVEQETHAAVGLLFAGVDDGSTFACPIDTILSAFNVTIV